MNFLEKVELKLYSIKIQLFNLCCELITVECTCLQTNRGYILSGMDCEVDDHCSLTEI